MAKEKPLIGVEPPVLDNCPPDFPKIEMENVVLSPELVKLRYDLLVRRGKAWGASHWWPAHSN